MAVANAQVVVGTTATALNAVSLTGGYIFLANPAGQTVFIGGAGVTTATGVPMPASTTWPQLQLTAGEVLYGVVAATTATVGVLQT